MTEYPDAISLVLGPDGQARRLGDGETPSPQEGVLWQHLRLGADGTLAALAAAGLDAMVIDALTAGETRPRCTVHENGVILTLRGVNLHPGAAPEDMISIRLWLSDHQIVSVWMRPLFAVADLMASVDRGQAPVSQGDLVARLAVRLADRAEPVVAELNEDVDALEEALQDPGMFASRSDLAETRRMAIILRRYLVPQRDALTTLAIEDLPWLAERDRALLREAAERIYRLGEDLDAIRDRTEVVQDRIMDRRADQMNRNMLLLSVVAAIFLPLGLLTGLLGINVGGMPGASNPFAFWIVVTVLIVLGGVGFWLVRRMGMLR